MINSELYIYKRNKDTNSFEFVGILEKFQSAIWHEKFYDKGEIEIIAPCTQETLNLLKTGNIVLKNDIKSVKNQVFMEIKQITITSDDEQGDVITANGVSSSELLERRIVWRTRKFVNKNIVDVLYTLVLGEMGAIFSEEEFSNLEQYNPLSSARSLSLYSLKADRPNIPITLTMQTTGKNVLESVKQLCAENGLGFKITTLVNYKEKKDNVIYGLNGDFCKFQILVPVDRTKSVIFSDDFDNIFNATYVKNITNSKNIALLAARGEGVDRERFIFFKDYAKEYRNITTNTQEYGSLVTGYNRFEEFVDVRDTDNSDLTEDEYIESLRATAAEKFGNLEESFDGEMHTEGVFKYNRDFFLGDFVTINKFELKIKAQVVECIESFDENDGYICTPIFAY